MNIQNIVQLLTSNPQQIINKIMGNNPIANNLINMMNQKDQKGIEQMARNLAKEKGKDPDEMYNEIKKAFGIN